MSLMSSIADELKRSPVAALSGAAGAVIAALSLGLAWLQYQGATPAASPSVAAPTSVATELFLGNVFLVIAYFLAVTIAASLLLRAVARKHDIAAFFASVPLVALANFSTILVIYIAPPRSLSAQLFSSAHDVVFYASASIVIAFCGKAVLVDIFSEGEKKTAESDSNSSSSVANGLTLLVMALLFLALWGGLVFAGQTRLTRTLLPEVTHYADAQPSKSDT